MLITSFSNSWEKLQLNHLIHSERVKETWQKKYLRSFCHVLKQQGCRSCTELRFSRTDSLNHAMIFFQKVEITPGSVVKRVKACTCFLEKGEIQQKFIIKSFRFLIFVYKLETTKEKRTKNPQFWLFPSLTRYTALTPWYQPIITVYFVRQVFKPITKPLSSVIIASMLARWQPHRSSAQ